MCQGERCLGVRQRLLSQRLIIRLVHGQNVRNLHHSSFDKLKQIAGKRLDDQDGRIGQGSNIGLALAHSNRFNQDDIAAMPQQKHRRKRLSTQAAQTIPRRVAAGMDLCG